jgi:hypothetical protein
MHAARQYFTHFEMHISHRPKLCQSLCLSCKTALGVQPIGPSEANAAVFYYYFYCLAACKTALAKVQGEKAAFSLPANNEMRAELRQTKNIYHGAAAAGFPDDGRIQTLIHYAVPK